METNQEKKVPKRLKLDSEVGICPRCGEEDLEFESSEEDDDCMYHSYTCQVCGFKGSEIYSLIFVGHRAD